MPATIVRSPLDTYPFSFAILLVGGNQLVRGIEGGQEMKIYRGSS